jgi:hypothetical protein
MIINVKDICTLLNGEYLRKPKILNRLGNNQASLHNKGQKPLDNNTDVKCKMDPTIMNGLESLDNPVLRGSFIYVLTEE